MDKGKITKIGNQGGRGKSYSDEFKSEAVKLVTSGERSQAEVARNLGIGTATISKWCNQMSNAQNDNNKLQSAELKRLKEENRRLKLEQEILKKAAAFFAKNQM